MRVFLVTFFVFLSCLVFAQNIIVKDSTTKKLLVGTHVKIGESNAVTDANGNCKFSLNDGNYKVEISFLGYRSFEKNVFLKNNETYIFLLTEDDILLNEMVITGSKYAIESSKSTVSIDVVSPELISNNNATSADQILQRIPGVEILDGQPNIRGGSGYSYGAGSRVLVLLDDIPILQADAGFPQWNDLPLELTGQIEVLKGASSALYGSSALNGIINLRTTYANGKPETGFFCYYKGFSAISGQQWWSKKTRPFEFGYGLYHKEKVGKTDFVIGAFSKTLKSFNRGTTENYKRISGNLKYRPIDRLKLGVNFNVNQAQNSEFFFWKGLDSLFTPANNTLSTVSANRFNIDPSLQYFDKRKNRHKILSRYHFVNNETNANRSNKSQLGYIEYQFFRTLEKINASITAGTVLMANSIEAKLYGDTTFSTRNNALYAQFDVNPTAKLRLSFGTRYERNLLKTPEFFNCIIDPITNEISCDTVIDGRKSEAHPVFRAGLNYQLAKATFFRASIGQGYRYPTVAEQFIKTTFGGIPISPNTDLQSEKGWSAELAIKQGFRIKKYNGFLDFVIFRSDYINMIEFNFIDLTTTGFQSVNIGNTSINGIEVSAAGQVKFGKFKLSHLAGYNHISPKFLEFDTSAVAYTNPTTEGQINANNSSSKENILKYRFRNTFKYDVELSYGAFNIGSSANYFSHMEAIDAIFEGFVVPGLRDYRVDNNQGNFILNLRTGYKSKSFWTITFLCNNIFNKAYSMRPGLMESPRNYTIRLAVKF